jgi:hypothetical protein
MFIQVAHWDMRVRIEINITDRIEYQHSGLQIYAKTTDYDIM